MARRRSNTPAAGEVYFELIVIGKAVKVSAVHAATGTEVSISGPTSAGKKELEKVALQKLIHVMERNAAR